MNIKHASKLNNYENFEMFLIKTIIRKLAVTAIHLMIAIYVKVLGLLQMRYTVVL
jgi:hypothetical protein